MMFRFCTALTRGTFAEVIECRQGRGSTPSRTLIAICALFVPASAGRYGTRGHRGFRRTDSSRMSFANDARISLSSIGSRDNGVSVDEHATRHRHDVGREDEWSADAQRTQLLLDLLSVAMRRECRKRARRRRPLRTLSRVSGERPAPVMPLFASMTRFAIRCAERRERNQPRAATPSDSSRDSQPAVRARSDRDSVRVNRKLLADLKTPCGTRRRDR